MLNFLFLFLNIFHVLSVPIPAPNWWETVTAGLAHMSKSPSRIKLIEEGQIKLETGFRAPSFVGRVRPLLEALERVDPDEMATEQSMGLGACHIMSTALMVQDATGISINKARLFLYHLLNSKTGISPIQRNLDFIASERTRPVTAQQSCGVGAFSSWEGASFQRNLEALQTFGAVLTPDKLEWEDVEKIMFSLNNERSRLISSPNTLSEAEQSDRLFKAGLSDLEIASRDRSDQESIERKVIQTHLQDYKITALNIRPRKSFLGFNFQKEEKQFIEKETRILAQALRTNAIYLNVDADMYVEALKGADLKTFARQAAAGISSARHAIVLVGVGFEASTPVFFIKDPNFKDTLVLSANNIVRSASSALILQKGTPAIVSDLLVSATSSPNLARPALSQHIQHIAVN